MSFIPLLFYFVVIIPSAIIHEYAHGWMANQLGDPTAKLKGRLSLDPRVHVDPWGTLAMPLLLFFISGGSFLFAYAKPVPINLYNLDDQRWGSMWVALAGPASNFILAAVFGLIFMSLPIDPTQVNALVNAAMSINPEILADLLSPQTGFFIKLGVFLVIIVFANVLLGVFNMVPIPPLDGSKVLFALLPDSYYEFKQKMERYKFVILIAFLFFGFQLIVPIIVVLTQLFTGSFI